MPGWALGPREVMRAMEDAYSFDGVMPSGPRPAGAAGALDGPQDWQADAVATYARCSTRSPPPTGSRRSRPRAATPPCST